MQMYEGTQNVNFVLRDVSVAGLGSVYEFALANHCAKWTSVGRDNHRQEPVAIRGIPCDDRRSASVKWAEKIIRLFQPRHPVAFSFDWKKVKSASLFCCFFFCEYIFYWIN